MYHRIQQGLTLSTPKMNTTPKPRKGSFAVKMTSHSPYKSVIKKTISTLNEKGGSSRAAIVKCQRKLQGWSQSCYSSQTGLETNDRLQGTCSCLRRQRIFQTSRQGARSKEHNTSQEAEEVDEENYKAESCEICEESKDPERG